MSLFVMSAIEDEKNSAGSVKKITKFFECQILKKFNVKLLECSSVQTVAVFEQKSRFWSAFFLRCTDLLRTDEIC